jgi:hypothetical protein
MLENNEKGVGNLDLSEGIISQRTPIKSFLNQLFILLTTAKFNF